MGRRASVTLLGLITGLGSLFVIFFSKGLVALDTMDFWVGTALIFVLATFQVVLYAWVLGVEKGRAFAAEGAEMHLPAAFSFIIKYVSPVYLLTVFVFWAILNFPGYVKQILAGGVPLMTVSLLGALTVFLLLLIGIGGKRWKAEERGAVPLPPYDERAEVRR
jgi:hypothetical protein